MRVTCPGEAFDAAFHVRAPRLRCRPENPADRAFLIRQFIACSPMASILPPAMLEQQAAFHLAAHEHAHPDAMRRIAMLEDVSIGRFVIAWTPASGHGVDLAVMPDRRGTGVGLHFLRAWLAVCDATGRSASLEVTAANPAARLYRRLGFVPVKPDSGPVPIIAMIRPASVAPGAPAAAQ